MYTYTLTQWLLLFYIYCFLGWCFESAYVSLLEHRLVNRGFLRAPFLPIYGSGALCILLVCLPVRQHVLLVYVFGVIFPTLLEYVTGAVMGQLFHMKYWDYTDKKCNLHGYICLESSLAWGVLSVVLIDYIHPPIAEQVLALPHTVRIVLAVGLTVPLSVDFVLSFQAAFSLRKVLEELERIRTQLNETRVQLALARADVRNRLEERRLTHRAEALRAQLERQTAALRYWHRALLRAHPTAASTRFETSLRLLRERAIARQHK